MIEILRNIATKAEYDKYLSKVEFDRENSSNEEIALLAPNVFIANWIKAKYLKDIQKELEKTEGKIKVKITTKKEINKQVSKKMVIQNNSNFTYTSMKFDNFIVGENNKLAFESAKDTINQRGRWNPLFIYGDTGLGKTHLLNAIANEIFKKNSKADVISITMEAMMNEFTHRLQNPKTLGDFRERFRNCEYLLLDDVQFIEGKEKLQEELFNTFNEIVKKGGQVVMTCDKPPKLIKKIPDRMKSRFEGGLMAKINHPELETKIKIIEQRCIQNDIKLTNNQIRIIALNYGGNIRAIDGIIITLRANAAIMGMDINDNMINQSIKDRDIDSDEITFEDIIKVIATEYNIKASEIRTKVRAKNMIAKARKITAFIAKQESNLTMPQIASELNLRDHSAVSKQIKILSAEIKKDKELEGHIKELILKIKRADSEFSELNVN